MPSNILLSRGTTFTTPENMKEVLKTSKQSCSRFPANEIPVRISVKLPFGAGAQNGLLYIMSSGSITKGRRLSAGVDLPPVSKSVYMTLKNSFNFSMAEPFKCKKRLFRLLAVFSV